MKNWKGRLTLLLGSLVAAYVAVCVYFFSVQTQKIFDPCKEILTTPDRMGMNSERVEIPVTSDGEKIMLDAVWIPAKNGGAINDAPSILYLHGQDDTIGKNLEHGVRQLHALGYNLLKVDYRGFGESFDKYKLSEKSVYEDAEAAWQYLINDRGARPEQTIIYGHSLGGAIAIKLAIDHIEAAGLIVESTFTSVIAMSRERHPFLAGLLPMKLLVNSEFDSEAKIDKLEIPVLLIHGTADAKVPHTMSDQLYEKASLLSEDQKDVVKIEGGEHANSASIGSIQYKEEVSKFVNRRFQPGT